jgi:hypothetical protein
VRPRLSVVLVAAGVLGTPCAAGAQEPARAFLAVDGAWQSANPDFRDNVTFLLNAETGDLNADYRVGTGRAFDAEAGARIWRRLVAGAAVSYFDKRGIVSVDARLPHPFFFNRPRAVAGEADRIGRTEFGLHLLAGWLLPLSDRLDLLVSGGPSYIRLEQSLVEQVAFTETFPFNSAAFAGVSTNDVEAGSWGMNTGADLIFHFHRHFGLGTRVRFSRASVDVQSADGDGVSIDVGGLQVMAGLRVRF